MGIRVLEYTCLNTTCVQHQVRHEWFVPTDVLGRPQGTSPKCDACEGDTTKLMSAPRAKLEGLSGSFPSASDKWANQHEEAARVASKKNADRNQWERETGQRDV